MPIYNKKTLNLRIKNGSDYIRRVYEGRDLVYSLYDIIYNTGEAVITEEKPAQDTWGNTTPLPQADYESQTYTYWYKEIATKDKYPTRQPGYVAGDAISDTEKSNYNDYNLYLNLERKAIVNKTNGPGLTTLPVLSIDSITDAIQQSEINAWENDADGVTGSRSWYENLS